MVKAHHGGKYKNNHIGTFIPKNLNKYRGSTKPVYKSQLEFLTMRYMDSNPMICEWSYEGKRIKYFDKVTNRVRTYHIDFVAKVNVGSGLTKTIWIEVKPLCETMKPKNEKDVKGLKIFITNQCKWQAAQQLAKSQGCEFKILTEEQLK